MALFESIRLRDGIPFFVEAHLRRLRDACDACRFVVEADALSAAGQFLREMGGNGLARIYVTAGAGSVTDPAERCNLYIFCEQRDEPTRQEIRLVVAREVYHPLFGGLKTANYWANVHLLQRARLKGAEEALLFNQKQELVSACMANVFLVHGAEIRTPSLASGARDGVIREWVHERAAVKECSLFVDDVRTADEIFLTNSWIGILPVSAVEGRPLPSRRISAALAEQYATSITATK